MPIYRLNCKVNNYHWGKHGLASKAAQFASLNPSVTIAPAEPYSELWMGTHPSGPSEIFGTNQLLSEVIAEDPQGMLGQTVNDKYQGQLPFLFKVLSIDKALSIQAHPDKQLARQLHGERPDVYRDANHKPEMSIALTEFVALSGFRPLEEIREFLEMYLEFKALVPNTVADFVERGSRETLKRLFGELMQAPQTSVQEQLDALLGRLPGHVAPGGAMTTDTSEIGLVRRLNSQYPGGDVGVFCVFMLNVLRLNPGEAFYMGANDPHAYISGDCVECMATSDNVVRAGLTPKLRDVEVLIGMLTYEHGLPANKLLAPKQESASQLLYNPPIDEFKVVRTQVAARRETKMAARDAPQILLVTEGTGKMGEHLLVPGSVYFISANTETVLAADQDLVAYTAC